MCTYSFSLPNFPRGQRLNTRRPSNPTRPNTSSTSSDMVSSLSTYTESQYIPVAPTFSGAPSQFTWRECIRSQFRNATKEDRTKQQAQCKNAIKFQLFAVSIICCPNLQIWCQRFCNFCSNISAIRDKPTMPILFTIIGVWNSSHNKAPANLTYLMHTVARQWRQEKRKKSWSTLQEWYVRTYVCACVCVCVCVQNSLAANFQDLLSDFSFTWNKIQSMQLVDNACNL